MSRRAARLLATSLFIAAAVVSSASQTATFRIVQADPNGVLEQMHDANEIRILFSEPMVTLGRIPSNPTPAWIHIAPATRGTYRWSGTTMLVFTPDSNAPLPFATTYTVTIDRTAESASGHQLGASYQFTFTTPVVTLTATRWMRQGNRFDAPVALALTFNQPVRPADILAHVAVRYDAHDWNKPSLDADIRMRLQTSDPDGLRRFDAKVAAVDQAAKATAPLGVRLALNWDRERFHPDDTLVVLETTAAPPPESQLRLTIDGRVPSPAGAATPGRAQTSAHELESAFFVDGPSCREACAPSGYNSITFTSPVAVDAFAQALTIRDVTDPARDRAVARTAPVKKAGEYDSDEGHGIEDAGFARQPAASTWLLRLDGSLRARDGQTLGYPWLGTVENWHDPAFSSFGDGHGVWEKDNGPLLPFSARNLQSVTQWLAPVAPADLMSRILDLQKNNFTDTPTANGTARTLAVRPDAVQAYGLDIGKALSPRGTGLVWAAVRDGSPIPLSKPVREDPKPSATLVQVTNLGITVKDSPQSTLTFVTRLDTGDPVADAKVTIVTKDRKAIWTGKTNRDGVALAPALTLRQPDSDENYYNSGEVHFLVTAEKDGDIAYDLSNWDEGIEPWEFGLSSGLWESSPVLRGAVFTDRGVYRPGEDVHVKAIVRSDTPIGMRLLAENAPLDITVTDSRDRTVDHRVVKVNRWSSVEWTWTVPAAGVVGNYQIVAKVPEAAPAKPDNDVTSRRSRGGDWLRQISGDFLVAAYRRPDFRVDTALTVGSPIAGESLHARVEGKYLFGASMAKRTVTWTLRREPHWGAPAAVTDETRWKDFRFGYFPDRAEREEKAGGEQGVLDATGALVANLPTATGVDFAYNYVFEGDVEDLSRQHIASRSSVVVYPAPFFIGVRQPDYFADPKTGTRVDIGVADLKGAAVSAVAIDLSLIRVQWNSVRHAEGHGFYTWETKRIETPAGHWTVTSAATPVTQNIPVPEGGYYILRATAKDAQGHTTRTETSFYGVGDGYTAWERFDHNRIKFEPEKNSWKPGETARIMIQSPWERATALLTVEREGVRSYKQFALTSTQQTVEMPITDADIPNVYVSILLVRGRTSKDVGADGDDPGKPSFRLGYTELHVEDAAKKLAVQVTADRPEYRPANAAKVSVAVTDAAGRPARGEVTLWAVDYGVLSLTGYEPPDVVHQVWKDKELEVTTTDNRQRIISRRVLTPKGAGEGGGGGAENGPNGLRKDFRPLAFWLGSLETDGNGKATTSVTLPDALTTYRIMAVAGDTASRFGSANADIRVSKPVTMLAAFPRFLSLGDHASFGATVSNTTAAGGAAAVTIRSLDPGIVDFEQPSQTIQLGAGASESARFQATAKGLGTARVEMTVKLGANSDAFQSTLVVSALAPIETQAAYGDTDSRTTQPIGLPAGVTPSLGGLQIDLASTALVGLGEGVRYLWSYPYDCAEQRASRALGLLLASDLGKAFSMGNVQPAEYRRQALALLAQLPSYQCPDGGFTFWPGRCQLESAYLTAYVLDVMHTTAGLGATHDEKVVTDALDYLEHALKAPQPSALRAQDVPGYGASLTYAVRVLAVYGRNQDANITRLLRLSERLPIFALSDLADALAASKDKGPRYQNLIRLIGNALRVEGDQAHAQEADDDTLRWLWDSNVRATAIVLEGFVRRGDDNPFVAQMVRWLLAARSNGRWDNTQENILALRALVAYYKVYEAAPPDFVAKVSIGTTPMGTATFKGRSTQSQSLQLSMRELVDRLATPNGASDLVVERTGTGRVYYTARLQSATLDAPTAVNHGITVARRYEKFVEGAADSAASTTFAAGDLIRVTLTVTLTKERRYVAVTDPLPAGFEPVEGWFRTTAGDLAREASAFETDDPQIGWQEFWRHGGFDNVERYDDRVLVFGTRLGEGKHEFSYIVRATTAGTFKAAGPLAEEMYAPEVNGRAPAATVIIR